MWICRVLQGEQNLLQCVQTSELLLPRMVEIRTDCAEAATALQARRRNNRVADIERFALELTSRFLLIFHVISCASFLIQPYMHIRGGVAA